MKIGIITQYYKSANYGGLLQAYALSLFLKQKGFVNEQICFNYYSHSKDSLNKRSILNVLNRNGLVKSLFLVGKRYFVDKVKSRIFSVNKKIAIRKKSCEYFRESLIAHSTNVYNNDSIEKCQDYDVLITGSDQVWSFNCFHPGFWLTFANPNVKKISYAASISMKEIPMEKREFVRESLSSFTRISVREKQDIQLLKEILGSEKDISWVLDPTLLLQPTLWHNICENNPYKNEKYIFAYLLGDKKADRSFIRRYAKYKKMKIIFIPYIQNHYRACDDFFGDIQLAGVSPQLFLSLIKDASCVITDSFHGTVFSNIFETNFYVLKRDSDESTHSANSRLYSLLDMLNLTSRIIPNDMDVYDIEKLPKINYDYINSIISEQRNKSEYFLINALEN